MEVIMKLEDARADIERRFTMGPQGNYRYAATGEEYVQVSTGGLQKEGRRGPGYYSTPAGAVRAWRDAVLKYAKLCDSQISSKTLYWRNPPELDSQDYISVEGSTSNDKAYREACTITLWRVYSRLLISDKPQIQPALYPGKVA
jgi:hypothetical protein